MSDIKVGDKVYLNPESKFAHGIGQLPLGIEAEVLELLDGGWVMVGWSSRITDYPVNQLIKLEKDKPLQVHKVGQNVSPKEVDGDILTGCGVILSMLENKYNVSYEVLTDFGNVVTLTQGDFETRYKVTTEDIIISVEERIQIQMDKLTNVWLKLKEGGYNEQE